MTNCYYTGTFSSSSTGFVRNFSSGVENLSIQNSYYFNPSPPSVDSQNGGSFGGGIVYVPTEGTTNLSNCATSSDYFYYANGSKVTNSTVGVSNSAINWTSGGTPITLPTDVWNTDVSPPLLKYFTTSLGWDSGDYTVYSYQMSLNTLGVCLLKGTKVLTLSGEIPIEELNINDEIITLSGIKKIEKIIKYERIGCENNIPFVIPKDHYGTNVPCEDLSLSREHSIYLNDKFYCVDCLSQRETNIQPRKDLIGKKITFYHLAFRHYPEVFIANNLTVESCGVLAPKKEIYTVCEHCRE